VTPEEGTVSYLSSPRIHFAGRFQADTSTINNDVRHYDTQRFCDDFQKPMEVMEGQIIVYNGYWNPDGSGAWRLLGCKVTAAVLDGCVFDRPEMDPVVGLQVGGSNDRVAAKLVDLDPQQQMVSQIWGLSVRLEDACGIPAFSGEFEVTAFSDIWKRQQKVDEFLDQQLSAAYQSVLTSVKWSNFANSACLTALRERSADGLLSIRMNVFGYDRTPNAADYGTGRLVGTIGPARLHEPRHFVLGRQLIAAFDPSNNNPFIPANQVANIQAEIDESAQAVTIDLGNALPVTDSRGTLEKIGPVAFGVLKDARIKQGDCVTKAQIELLGPIPYEDADWYLKTAGIQEFQYQKSGVVEPILHNHPLALVRQDSVDQYTVLNRETVDGLYVRADTFVYRLDPGDSATIGFYASKYGRPYKTPLRAWPTSGMMGGSGTNAQLPPSFIIPDVQTPIGIIKFPSEFSTDEHGRGRMTITAAAEGPGNPRVYIDGQLYGIGYQIKYVPDDCNPNPFRYISVLAWDQYEVPEEPTWFEHVRPILRQYGNLYPIMSKHLIDLQDYESVVGNLGIMKLSFSLPSTDPNSMPVTRDLSRNKRLTLLKWLDARDPTTNLPPLGRQPSPKPEEVEAATGHCETIGHTRNLSSKAEFLRQALKSRR
jgi:hypothetical protein